MVIVWYGCGSGYVGVERGNVRRGKCSDLITKSLNVRLSHVDHFVGSGEPSSCLSSEG